MFIADYLDEYNLKLEYIKIDYNVVDIYTKNLKINNVPEFIEINNENYKINKNNIEIEDFNINERYSKQNKINKPDKQDDNMEH
ncbi:hypothetical protein H8356DRAFT_1363155 [Neocallimastix lanati (nom. inval.)]|nr:hypothetical protein H8356DRAFT_1363155 [Neocallimastix sp. JGI-2020a]